MPKYSSRASIKYSTSNIQSIRLAPLTLAVSGSLAMAGTGTNTIEVESLAAGITPGVCTLREAITAVNDQQAFGDCPAPEASYPSITFASQLEGYIIESESLLITESVRIDGDERIDVALDLYESGSVLIATDSVDQLTIEGLGVWYGNADYGGGLYSEATNLTIRDSIISNNFAATTGGGVFHVSPVGGEVEIRDSELSGNLAYGGGGGGLYLSKTGEDEVRIRDNVISNNQVFNNGGGVLLKADQADDVIVKYNQFQDNHAVYGMGGGLAGDFSNGEAGFKYNQFSDSKAIDGAAVGFVASNQQINTLQNIYNSGEASDYGGGLYANLQESYLYIDDADVTQNEAFAGSGFYITGNQAEVVINRSDITGNSSTFSGGGIELTGGFDRFELRYSRLSDNLSDTGSHIAMGLRNTDISGNLSIHSSELSLAYYGGGGIDASLAEGAELLISNSTLVGNFASDFGAIRAEGNGTLQVAYSTLADNGSMYGGAGISSSLPCAVRNTIMANYLQSGTGELVGQACSVRHSLIRDPAGSNYSDDGGNLVDMQPGFDGAEQHDDLPTSIVRLAPDSPAVFAGNDFGNAPEYDQRGPGFERVSGDGLDMGAFELQTLIFQDRFETP